MILGLLLHLTRVYLTGGFKAPREITWLSGVVLSVLTSSSAVTGYSLPWDQVGFWACKILTSLPTALPVLGRLGATLLRGGESVCEATLIRFYLAHTFLIPLLLTTILLGHFLIIRKQGISGPV
jgi:cytochrome b6